MKKLTVLAAAIVSFVLVPSAQASDSWEVRRLKDGRCEVAKVKPGAKPGNRIAGPYNKKMKANAKLRDLEKTPKCK